MLRVRRSTRLPVTTAFKRRAGTPATPARQPCSAMLARQSYTQEELDHAKAAIKQQMAAHKALANTAASATAGTKLSAALNEVEMLCDSLMNNDGILRAGNVIKLIPEESVVKLRIGERIRLTAEGFDRALGSVLRRDRTQVPSRGARRGWRAYGLVSDALSRDMRVRPRKAGLTRAARRPTARRTSPPTRSGALAVTLPERRGSTVAAWSRRLCNVDGAAPPPGLEYHGARPRHLCDRGVGRGHPARRAGPAFRGLGGGRPVPTVCVRGARRRAPSAPQPDRLAADRGRAGDGHLLRRGPVRSTGLPRRDIPACRWRGPPAPSWQAGACCSHCYRYQSCCFPEADCLPGAGAGRFGCTWRLARSC